MPKIDKVDHGKILSVECPECKKNCDYHLHEEIDRASAWHKMLLVRDIHSWHIKCDGCGHIVKVANEEAENIFIIHELADKMEKGEITSEEFYKVFGQFPFVAELLNQKHAWDCPNCNERISWNYQVCWNCSTPNPEFDGMDKGGPPEFIKPKS